MTEHDTTSGGTGASEADEDRSTLDTSEPEWWISRDGERLGPFTHAQMHERARTNELTPAVIVWRAGMSDWQPASATDLAGLWGHKPTATPPTPPPSPHTSSPPPPRIPSASTSRPPTSSRSGATASDAGVPNGWAWALVTAPLILTAVDIALMGTGSDAAVGFVVAIALNTFFAIMDHRAIERAGLESPGLAWAVFLVPVYLFKRARLLGQDQRILAAWVVAFIVSFLPATESLASSVVGMEVDARRLEGLIEDDIRDQFGVRAQVECPDGIPLDPGETFRCIAEGGGDRAVVRVEVQNRAGDVFWEYG